MWTVFRALPIVMGYDCSIHGVIFISLMSRSTLYLLSLRRSLCTRRTRKDGVADERVCAAWHSLGHVLRVDWDTGTQCVQHK